jgi:RNA polymerase sigma factor (sigma-70 family)
VFNLGPVSGAFSEGPYSIDNTRLCGLPGLVSAFLCFFDLVGLRVVNTLESKGSAPSPAAAQFRTTHWSVVLQAQQSDSPEASAALARLCEGYWYPLYAYVRREGRSPVEAMDLTQEFFARLIEKNFLNAAVPEKGRFRSFLLVLLKRFLVNEWHRANRQKRGGGQELVSLDESTAEDRYKLEPADDMSPDRIYERRWVFTLLNHVLDRIQHEFAAAGKREQFELLKPFLYGDQSPLSQAEIGVRLGMSEGAVKGMVYRLRRQYQEALRREIANTVASPTEIEDELRHLLTVLRG